MRYKICCPECGSEEIQVANETTVETKGYSAGKGCLGFLLFGPLGFLCGGCGNGTKKTDKTYWHCSKCGKKFKTPNDIRESAKGLKKGIYFSLVCGILGFILLPIWYFVFHEIVLLITSIYLLANFVLFWFPCLIFFKKVNKEADEMEAAMKKHQCLK